jgi:hypothetical protein
LASANVWVPLRLPDPVHDPTLWAVVLFIVPAANPLPDTVQVTFETAIVSLPDVRSALASRVSVVLLAAPVFDLAVTEIAPSDAVMLEVVSGSAFGNDTVVLPSESLAVADTVAETVTFFVSFAASTHSADPRNPRTTKL